MEDHYRHGRLRQLILQQNGIPMTGKIKRPHRAFLILILGALTTISPFSIDMYLPAFPQVAAALHTTVAKVSLSLSSYFVGLAVGQMFYGPMLDRYGRKKPLYVGLALYVVASIGCLTSRSVEMLIAWRLLQALGGCAASVASMAMVQDFFPAKDSAKVFSLLILVLSVSPLLAPTIGSFFSIALGWQSVFVILAAIVVAIMLVVMFFLPEGHKPDQSISLNPKHIIRNFVSILVVPQFYTYALAGSFAFATLLVYISASPVIFMDMFHISSKAYSLIFGFLALGFIGSSQLNIWFVNRFGSHNVFKIALIVELLASLAFLLGAYLDIFTLPGIVGTVFVMLFCLGLIYPNAAALALAPFGQHAGSASALLGCLQIGIPSVASAGVGLFVSQNKILPASIIMACTATIAVVIILFGRKGKLGRGLPAHQVNEPIL
jgi:DHA1 family bicyclomycin/chloramphenicol resistance-like MFS transporter